MSIENNLASIAASLAVIAEALKNGAAPATTVAAPVAAPAAAPVAAPTPAPVLAFTASTPAPVAEPAAACPITDQPSLVNYVMTSYKEMGPVKGNQIQGVLVAQGITNINDAKAEHYPAIFKGIEALKAQ